VDGVHDGLWIDDPQQAHPPYVVIASPTDFDAPVQIEATDVDEWLALVAIGDLQAADWDDAARGAADNRRSLGLPPIPTEGAA
jgi:hypothetical protein